MANYLKGERIRVGWKSPDILGSRPTLVWTTKRRLLNDSRYSVSVVMPEATFEEAQAIAKVRGVKMNVDHRKDRP